MRGQLFFLCKRAECDPEEKRRLVVERYKKTPPTRCISEQNAF